MAKKKKEPIKEPIPDNSIIICPSCKEGIMMQVGKEYHCPDCGYIGCANCGTL